jgi:quinol-cytochrome oxidoreductase complex cytochrome b subunit
MENPFHRPFMTSLGVGAIVFLCMMVVAGYIDVLKITPNAMTVYAIIATAAAWGGCYALLRWYNGKRGH